MLRQRLPALATVGSVVKLASRGTHIHPRRRTLVRCHGFAQHQQVGVLLRQAAREQLPGLAAGAAASYAELGLGGASEFGAFDGHGEQSFLFGRRHRHAESEARRQAAGNVGPFFAVKTGFVEAAMVLLIQALGVAGMRQQMVYALSHLGKFFGLKIGAHALVEGLPGGAAVARAEGAGGRDGDDDSSLAQTLNGMQAHSARAGVPAAARGVRRQRGHLGPGLPPVRSEERRVGKERRSRWSPYHSKKRSAKRDSPPRFSLKTSRHRTGTSRGG